MTKWIQKAVKRKGSLKRNIREKYGNRAFTDQGTIKVEYLHKASKLKGKIGQRARLALTLRRLRK